MNIQVFSLGSMQANCYFVSSNNDCVIIDPADEANFILEKLQQQNLNLIAMIATHGHFDHLMAVGEIQLTHDVPLYIHRDDLFLVDRLEETAKHYLGADTIVLEPQKIEFIESKFLAFGDFRFEVIHTPGHTPGGVCLYLENDNCLFTGDTLFKQAIGRYDFSYSDKNLLKESLSNLSKLPRNTVVYPGHSEPTTIGEESESK